MEISYKLDNFEGPLDLLLHLIEKNKVKYLRYSDRPDYGAVSGIC